MTECKKEKKMDISFFGKKSKKSNFGSCDSLGYKCNGGVSGSCGDVVGSGGSCCKSACKTDATNFMQDTLLNDTYWKQQVYNNSVNKLENTFTQQVPTMLTNFITNDILRQKNSRKQIMATIQGKTATALGYDPKRINSAELGVPIRMLKNGEYAKCSKYNISAPNKVVRYYSYLPYDINDITTLNILTKTNGRTKTLFSNEVLTSSNGLFKLSLDQTLGSINIYDNNGALAWDSSLYLDSFPTVGFTDAKNGSTTIPPITMYLEGSSLSTSIKKSFRGVYSLKYIGLNYTGPILNVVYEGITSDFYLDSSGKLITSSGIYITDWCESIKPTQKTTTSSTSSTSSSSS